MKTKLIWKDSNFFNKKQDGFWVSCDFDEAVGIIYPLLSEKEQEKSTGEYSGIYNSTNWATVNPTLAEKNRIYFLISQDTHEIFVFEAFFPYSSMWNYGSPFKYIEEYEFSSLSELQNIKPILIED
jgi:hypothetical protein